MKRTLIFTTFASMGFMGCVEWSDSAESEEEIGESQQALVPLKRRITYTLAKRTDGFYADAVSWTVNATPQQLTDKQVVPLNVTMTPLSSTQTRLDYPRMSNSYVEERWNNAIAGWASVANLEFVKVSGTADMVLTLHENTAQNPSSAPEAEGYWDLGRAVVINLRYVKPQANPPWWNASDRIPQNLHLGYESHFDTTAMHEIGHFLGLGHAIQDTVNYGRDHTQPVGQQIRGCTGTPCFGLGNDLAVMDYGTRGRVLINGWDVFKVQQRYGAPKHRPLIEMFLPYMGNGGEYFYTNSWDEASQLLWRDYDLGARFTRVVGVTYSDGAPTALRTAINRYYDPDSNGHSITLGRHCRAPTFSREFSVTPRTARRLTSCSSVCIK